MVVGTVDQGDLDRSAHQRLRRAQPTEASADDDDAVSRRGLTHTGTKSAHDG
jgi:hypothetical protein